MTSAQFDNDRKLIWLASYPKSGNTWLRSLLTAYLLPHDEFDLNAMLGEQDPFDRQQLDDHAGISSADFLPHELIPYQAQLHRDMAQESENWRLIKTHSAYVKADNREPLFPADASAGVIVIVRNPLDIVPSYAHHEGKDNAWVIAHLGNEHAGTDSWRHRSTTMLPQTMSSWSINVESWLSQSEVPILLLRYEDMHRDTEASLTKALRFCAIEIEPGLVTKAVSRCSIDRLRIDEAKKGFNERPSTQRSFFRSGKIGDGAKNLSKDQISMILNDHGRVMEMVGYPANSSIL
ncbi:sulfotransferase domain-containing protein [Pontixanthobacter aestiaquae]|uniref:Sulfotransferase domain-containing protein n=1 Tax=Pontixanthobacter aestiaquae TaxID=1509367 RepID=A0A844ZA38_9SPHN|nr:sulfotransferase domain-containing protein [Pontixanthobacter aestiaquae]MDN3644825.1 sulfotransferase domain-containing protein [Pontixanthobacter aestiaquae]MXO84172.1 hypothetical protein [Pontixanthobacter aestiaquae]